jgi:hypothetical protein
MLVKYKKIANSAAVVALFGFACAAYFGASSQTGNIWGKGGASEVFIWIITISILVAFWAYVKAKGRSGWLALVLPFFSIVGLIILLRLEDRSEFLPKPDVECKKCGGKNAAIDLNCRYCGFLTHQVN